MSKLKLLSPDELKRVLRDLPKELKWDLTQLALDLVGIVHPVADAASAGISLFRGDFVGAFISAVSIIPIGDVLKIAKLGKYAKTLETLVTKTVPRNPKLYEMLTPMMSQFRSLVAKIPSGNAEVEKMRTMIAKFFKNAENHRLISGMSNLAAVGKLAKRRGKWKNPAFAKGGTSPSALVDQLVDAAKHASHPTVRMNSKEIVKKMGGADWVISAGPHRTTKTAGNFADRTPHITVEINGAPNPFHIRLDKRGNIWEIRTVKAGEAVNPVAGSPRPWRGPGQ